MIRLFFYLLHGISAGNPHGSVSGNASADIYPKSDFLFLTCIFRMLCHWAYVIILLPVVVKILYGTSILLPGMILFFVEIIMLDKSLYTHIFHKLIVLFASITSIGRYYGGSSMISFPKIFQKRNKGSRISGSPVNPRIGNEPVLRNNLYAIGGLQLTVFHMILFHAHEGRIPICLTERITIPNFSNCDSYLARRDRYSSCSFLTCFCSALFIPESRLFKALTFSRKARESISAKVSGVLSCLSGSICLSTPL